MTELANTTASASDRPAAHPGIGLIRRLVLINLGLVALQPISAGLFLSGFEHAVTLHAAVAVAVQLGVLIQAATAVVLWRRRRAPAWVARHAIALFVIVFVDVGLGHGARYWLHVPMGVGIFGWLTWWTQRRI